MNIPQTQKEPVELKIPHIVSHARYVHMYFKIWWGQLDRTAVYEIVWYFYTLSMKSVIITALTLCQKQGIVNTTYVIKSKPVILRRLVVFSRYSQFFPTIKLTTSFNWNVVEKWHWTLINSLFIYTFKPA